MNFSTLIFKLFHHPNFYDFFSKSDSSLYWFLDEFVVAFRQLNVARGSVIEFQREVMSVKNIKLKLSPLILVLKQIMPDHVLLNLPLGKLRNRHVPILVLMLAIIVNIFGGVSGTYPW